MTHTPSRTITRSKLVGATSTSALAAAFLLTAAIPQAQAAKYLFGGNGTLPEGQAISLKGDVTQIQMDDGSILSLVGSNKVTLNGNSVEIDKGGVTVVSANGANVRLTFPGGSSATVTGAASVNVGASGVTGNVMGGDMRVSSNGRSRTFKAGASWQAQSGKAPGRVYANGAQQVPTVANVSEGSFAAAAVNGLPITLGQALQAIGVGGDIVSAAQSVDVRAANPALGTLPSGDISALIGFSQQLASALGGGQSFSSAQPALIESYLGFLAGGGQIAEFQSAYTALITQYLDLLSTGGLPSAFTGLDLGSVTSYLQYLDAEGITQTLAEQQRAIVSSYLDFLQGGGAPTEFLPPAAGLTDDAIAAYVMAIEDYVAFIAGGGSPVDFGISLDLVNQYLQQLSNGGLLETLLPIQAATLDDYLNFLGDGGDPADFDGFDVADMGDGDMGDGDMDGGDMDGGDMDGGDMGGGDMGGGDMDGGDMGGGDMDGGDMDGGDMGGGDMGGGDVDFATVGAGFDLTAASVMVSYNFDSEFSGPSVTQVNQNNVNITRSAEGAFQVGRENGQPDASPVFDVTSLTLEQLRGDDDVLIARYAAGTADTFFGTDIEVDVLNIVAVADPVTLLPVSGSAMYEMTQSNGLVLNDTDITEGTLDGSFSLTFGALPRIDIDILIGLDTTYTFSVDDLVVGLSNFSLLNASLRLAEATGTFCADGINCSVSVALSLTEDFAQAGASFRTNFGDVRGSGSAIFSSTTTPTFSFDAPDGAASGSLSAAFSGTQFAGAFSNPGGLNQSSAFVESYTNLEATFDANGLIEVRQEFPTFVQDILARGGSSVADLAGTQDWQVGRFNGGTPTGVFTQDGKFIQGPSNGVAYALVNRTATNLPTAGTASFSLLAATRPVYGDGRTAPGTFTGDIAIDFGALRVGLDATVTMPDATYSLLSAGGLADPSQSSLRISSTSTFSGVVDTITSADTDLCGSGGVLTCRTFVDGTLGGDGGDLLALSYMIRSNTFSEASLGGAAVFEGGPAVDLTRPTGTDRADQSIAYSSSVIGIDQRYPSTTTYDETTGAVLAYDWTISSQESPHRGTADVVDGGSVSDIIGWSRWAGGTSGGTYFASPGVDLPENGGWHLVSGTPATNLPTSGTATYNLVGSTAPTIRDGSLAPGSVTGSAAVAFGATARVGVELDVTIGGNAYGLSTTGGAADPMNGMVVDGLGNAASMQFRSNDIAVSGGGAICSGGGDCTGIIAGFLAGDGASHIGMAYTFGNSGFDTQVDGTAVFGRP